jgi:hypothetical protein
VSNRPRAEWELGREAFEGYTGNAGMTLERWYHRAAIVIWPREDNFHVLCEAGTDAAISGLKSMVAKWKGALKSEQPVQRKACLDFAAAIIESWSPPRFEHYSYVLSEKVDRSAFPLMLQELDDLDSVVRFLTRVMPNEGQIELDESFPAFCKRHGWAAFEEGLTAIIDAASTQTLMRNMALLETLCLVRDKNGDRINVCQELAERAVNALRRFDDGSSADDWRRDGVDRAALLVSLVKSLTAVKSIEPLEELFNHTQAQVNFYDLTDAHLAAIFALESWWQGKHGKAKRVIDSWLTHCRAELEKRTFHAPQPPADFHRDARLSCECADCRALSRFLDDPVESVHSFKASKDRRQHLEHAIKRDRRDLTCTTVRRSSPQPLVCTKTTASYQLACKTFARDTENLERLRAIERKVQ